MWREFKPILYFIGRFFLVYIVLTALYSWYLDPYLYDLQIADPITTWMAEAAVNFIQWFGYSAENLQMQGETFRRFILENQYASRVNEGCNAVSVMIIFISFIVAFAGKWLTTILFILVGLIIMILSNIVRIALLTWIFRFHKDYTQISHDYLFPAIIYGTVVILWLIWVKFFAFHKE